MTQCAPGMSTAMQLFASKVHVLLHKSCHLCCRYGVSKRLFEDFLRPLLLVGLFAPAEELSAAVVIGTLYFYGKPFIL